MATDNDDWADWNQPNQSATSDDSWAQFDGSTPSSEINFGSTDMFSQSSTAFGSFQSKTTLEDAVSKSPPKSSSQLDDQTHGIEQEALSRTQQTVSFGGPAGDEDLASSSQPSETQSITTLDTDNGNPAGPYSHPTEQYETASTAKIPRIVTKDPTFGDEDEEEEAYEDDDEDEFFKLKPLDVPAPTGDFQVSMDYQPDPEDEPDISSPADSQLSILPNSDHFDSSRTEDSETIAPPLSSSSIDSSPSNIHDHEDLFATSPQTPNSAEILATSMSQEGIAALDASSAHTAAFVSSGNPADSPVFSNEVTSQNEGGFANWTSSSTQTSEGFADWGSPSTSSDAQDFAHFPDNSSTATAYTKMDDGFASFDAPTLSNPTSSTSTPTPQVLPEQGLESSQPAATISDEYVRTPSKEETESEANMEDAKSDVSDPSSLENANPGSTSSVETSIIEHSEPTQEVTTEGEVEDKKPSEDMAPTSFQESERSITSNDNPIESQTELNGSTTGSDPSDHTENAPPNERTSVGHSHGPSSTSDTITELDAQSSLDAVEHNNEAHKESEAPYDEVQSRSLLSSTTTESEVPVATQAIDTQEEEFEPLEDQTPKQSTQASGFEDDFAEWSNTNADDGDLDAFADFDAQNGADDDDFDFPSTASNEIAAVPPQTHTPTSSQSSASQPSFTHSAGTVSQPTGTAHVAQGKPSVFLGSPSSVLEKVTAVLAPLNTLHLDLKGDVSNTLLDTPSLESIAGTVMEQKWEAKDSKRAPKPTFRNTHFESEFLTAIGKQPLPTISPGLESFMKRTPSGKRGSQNHSASPAMVMAPLQPLSAKESASISAALGLTPTVVTQPPAVAATLPSTPAGSSKTASGSHLITPTQSENPASSNLLASPVDIPLAPVDLSMFGPPPTTNTAAPKIVHDDSGWMSAFMGTTSTTSKQTRGESTPAPLVTPSALSKAGSTTPSDFSANRSLQTPMSPSETPDRTSTPELSVLPMTPSPSVSPAPNADSSVMAKSASSTLFSERLKRSGSSGGGFSRSSSGLLVSDTPPGAVTPTVEFEEGDEIGPIVHSLLKAMPNLGFMHHASVVLPRRS